MRKMQRRRSSRDSSEEYKKPRKEKRSAQKESESEEEQAEEVQVTCPDKEYKHVPLRSFKDAEFPSVFYQVFDKLGFVKPTPIQRNGIPIAMDNLDMVGVARTGSGKTLSFVLPALTAILEEKRYYRKKGKRLDNRKTPMALILAPTRELANQIYNSAKPFIKKVNIDITVIYGGASQWPQKEELNRGCDLLIATPGRLIDFIEKEAVLLKRVFYFVLDEADRMLDMGFIPQVEEIMKHIRPSRQTLLWSATWPKEVEKLSRKVCTKEPIKIQIGSEDLTVNKDIKQTIMVMEEFDKKTEIVRLLKEVVKSRTDKIIVFVKTKKGCDRLARTLEYEGYDAVAIHGDKAQNARDKIIYKFKKGYKNILVATDVASRGLDIKDIKFVINYDFPMTIEDYVHRIGRTGRAGAKGVSYTFFSSDDKSFSNELIELLKKNGHEPPRELANLAKANAYRKKKRYNRYGYNKGGGGGNWWGKNKSSYGGGGGNRGYNKGGYGGNRGYNNNSNNWSSNNYGGGGGGNSSRQESGGQIGAHSFRYEDRAPPGGAPNLHNFRSRQGGSSGFSSNYGMGQSQGGGGGGEGYSYGGSGGNDYGNSGGNGYSQDQKKGRALY